MTKLLLAAIDAVEQELAKGTPAVPPYKFDEGRLWVYRECEPDSGYYALTLGGYADVDYVEPALAGLVAIGNAAPGILAAAREQLRRGADMKLPISFRHALISAARALLTPIFREYADLPAVKALEAHDA